jgi:hypothetical protein
MTRFVTAKRPDGRQCGSWQDFALRFRFGGHPGVGRFCWGAIANELKGSPRSEIGFS